MKKSNILEDCFLEIKEPSNCSEKKINNFHELLVEGGKVSQKGLIGRIKNCELLAFCYFNSELIGISSIKKPNVNYIEKIIEGCAQLNVYFFNNLYLLTCLLKRPFRMCQNSS